MWCEEDKDSTKKILAEPAKLCGSVMYGATTTKNKCFTEVKFVNYVWHKSKLDNSNNFFL